MQLQLQPTALITVPKAPGHFLSSDCTPPTDVTGAAATIEEPVRESIPLGSITAIVREVVTRRPVQEEIKKTMSAVAPENLVSTVLEAGEAGPFAPAAPVLVLAIAGAMEPFRGVKTHIESVRILWTENGTPRSTNFSLSGRNVASLLSRLAEVTSKSWAEARFDSEAQSEHASQILVHFNEEVSAGEITVSEGNYRLLMLTASGATHLVYFFSEDKRMPQDAIAVFSAEASPLVTGKAWKIKLARNADGSRCLSEIDTDVERLQVHACRELNTPAKDRPVH
jgi:hypothetical protein